MGKGARSARRAFEKNKAAIERGETYRGQRKSTYKRKTKRR